MKLKRSVKNAYKAPENEKKQSNPVVVIGNGWAALGAAGFLAQAGQDVCWIAGTGGRVIAPLPSVEADAGGEAWGWLALRSGIEVGELQSGSYLREFRNKGFREPAWMKAPSLEARAEVRNELLWPGEARIPATAEGRYALSMPVIEESVRKALLSNDKVRFVDKVPVAQIDVGGEGSVVTLGNGESIGCSRVIYADRWNALSKIEGLPKAAFSLLRGREPVGVLQATFQHEAPMGVGVSEGFFNSLHKDAGDTIERHVWGCFTDDGMKSTWTVALAHEEGEDNHQIAKKLRRIKQSLDRVFTGGEWLPEGKDEFMKNVREETVRFEESALYSAGEPPSEPISIGGVALLTDGYGPASALHQVVLLLGEEIGINKSMQSQDLGAPEQIL